ncbi:MAG TPA: arginine deiminase-related protein [Chitinophagaceae bacterium]|nr:arginine deiminase-related protein [Chitinophagaceae bacterium]
MQTTSHLLMIRPVNFGYNAETAVNNAFQVQGSNDNVQQEALREFDAFVSLLRDNEVDVTVVDDSPLPHTPDSIFPNNWISFHDDGTLVFYPMYAVNRRAERNPAIIDLVREKFTGGKEIDLSYYEQQDQFLEGTGSMVLDRDNRIAYACLSPRTSAEVLTDFCRRLNYRPMAFSATDGNGRAIYHTNVMMCVADRYVVICLESIPDPGEQEAVVRCITESGKKIVPITLAQMNHFAGNMLQVNNRQGEKLLVLSSQAYASLTDRQVEELTAFNRIIHSSLDTIEANGGGSARCMMAEIHLKAKTK